MNIVRGHQDEIRVTVRGMSLRLYPGHVYKDLPSRDLFFALCGELHCHPCRFLSVQEIHESMKENFGVLKTSDKDFYVPDLQHWVDLRLRNASSNGRATIVEERMVTMTSADYNNTVRRERRAAAREAEASARGTLTAAVARLQPHMGRKLTSRLYELVKFEKLRIKGSPRPYAKGASGAPFRMLATNASTYRQEMALQGTAPYPTYTLPCEPAVLSCVAFWTWNGT